MKTRYHRVVACLVDSTFPSDPPGAKQLTLMKVSGRTWEEARKKESQIKDHLAGADLFLDSKGRWCVRTTNGLCISDPKCVRLI